MEVPPESSSAPQSEDRCVSMLTPQESQTARASRTAVTVAHQGNMPAPGTSQGRVSTPPVIINLDPTVDNCDWKMEPDPTEAVKGFRYQILNEHATRKPLNLVMDLGDSSEDRERAIISFYKMAHVEWASPLTCTLKGDPAIGDGVTRHFFSTIMSKLQMGFDICLVPGGTVLFEGQQDHLIPSTSPYLLESDFFVVAGRMIGHSFIHGGPTLAGLSPAIIHVLFGGAPEEAIIDIKDCVDLDVRDTIKLLDGTVELSLDEKNAINELAVSWDLPHVTAENRRWLLEKLLLHAVLTRTSRQLKQLRRGLKETLIWPLLTERKETIPLLFPRASEMKYSPQTVLDKINWPVQDEDSDVSLEDTCRITGFLRTFIENASSRLPEKLVQFWVGWSVLPRYMDVEVVESSFPKSSTCFHLLKLPMHYKDYSIFERDILAAVWSTDNGFGMV
nr:G2/M phase-specific E3 ubiquitin-protein ligase-like [Misgurnus anguillicaudatus]